MPKTSNPIQNLKTLVSSGLATAKTVARAEGNINKSITKLMKLSKKDAKLALAGKKSLTDIASKAKKKIRKMKSQINIPDRDVMAPCTVRKREFICNVQGNTGFSSNNQPISMQNPFLFPWGSQILPQFEMYKVKNIHFHFESSYPNITTGGSLGLIVMGIVYDPDDPTMLDLQTMLNYQGFQNRRIDKNLTIKWDPRHNPLPVRYVAHNPNANPFNDAAIFYWASSGNPNTNVIGQIWVEYDIELYIPRPSAAPNYQQFSTYVTSAAAGTYQFMDGASVAANTYGANFCTLTQGAGLNPTINFLVPGFYLLFYMESVGAGATVTQFINNSNVAVNTSEFGSQISDGNAGSTAKVAAGTVSAYPGSSQNWVYIDATTAFVNGNTKWTDGMGLTFTGTAATLSCTLFIFRITRPTSQLPPSQPELTSIRRELDELKQVLKGQEARFELIEEPPCPPTPVHQLNNWAGHRSQSHK